MTPYSAFLRCSPAALSRPAPSLVAPTRMTITPLSPHGEKYTVAKPPVTPSSSSLSSYSTVIQRQFSTASARQKRKQNVAAQAQAQAQARADAHENRSENKNEATTHEFETVSWPQVESLARSLSQQMEGRSERFDVILAVTRGGLVPATLLSQSLQLRNVLTTTVIFYTDDGDQFFGMTEPRFLSFPSAHSLKDRRVLIVDDVWDSGRTVCAVSERVRRAQPACVEVAVLHFKPMQNNYSDKQPDFYGCETDNWLVYPWEALSPSSPCCGSQDSTMLKAEEAEELVDVSGSRSQVEKLEQEEQQPLSTKPTSIQPPTR